MDPITGEQLEKRRADLMADLQQTEQQIAMWTEKRGLLRGALMEIEGWTKGDLPARYSPPGEMSKEPAAPEAK